ncbi:MAG: quercetin dioxygenase-like cupin family protein [Arcticibacterium sp.]|jgi:quercetin dioxygenase-like cupin family protein
MIHKSQEAFVKDKAEEWEQVEELIKRKIMSYDDKSMLVKVHFQKGGVGQVHSHYHCQTSYVESGSFEITIGNEVKLLKSGDVFYVVPNVLHGAICLEEGVLLDFFSPPREDFLS